MKSFDGLMFNDNGAVIETAPYLPRLIGSGKLLLRAKRQQHRNLEAPDHSWRDFYISLVAEAMVARVLADMVSLGQAAYRDVARLRAYFEKQLVASCG